MDFSIEGIMPGDLVPILALGKTVNETHVVPLLEEEGQKAIRIAFHRDIENVKDPNIYSLAKAVTLGEIIGYIAWRDGHYIGHLYVKTQYHGFGVAKRLVDEMKRLSGAKLITVKASIYALGFYKKVGFNAIAEEMSINGIRYVPMQLEVE